MSIPSPQVSVFHFTAKVSKAKIRKYKLATERGMSRNSTTQNPARASANVAHANTNSVRDEQSLSMDSPPNKKPRLKLNVRPQPNEGVDDTIAVSQPKRAPALKIRFSNDVYRPVNKDKQKKLAVSPPPASPISIKSSTPVKEPETNSARDDYGDFMSWYIAEGDDEQDKTEPPKPIPDVQSLPENEAPPKPIASKPALVDPTPRCKPQFDRQKAPTAQAPQQCISQAVTHQLQHARHPPVLPQPTIQFIDIPIKPSSTQPNTIAEMIDKLQKLSRALVPFTGEPAMSSTPLEEEPVKEVSISGDLVDDFLAQFEDSLDVRDLDVPLETPGTPDSELSFGMSFIQNALRAWAQQRLVGEVQERLQKQAEAQRSRKVLQRPGAGNPTEAVFQPNLIQLKLEDTHEGSAFAAFQDVLESGCLQVNGILPKELIQALRKLYKQVDRLINSSSKAQPEWTCMSYTAQIKAHNARVENWKKAQAQAQEEMVRQQHIAQIQMMKQMGLPGQHHQTPMNATQVHYAHVVEPERRRGSSQKAVPQHHISQQSPGSLQPSISNVVDGRNGHTNHPSPIQPTTNESLGTWHPPQQEKLSDLAGVSSQMIPNAPDAVTVLNKAGTAPVQLNKMKLYVPGFLPRSGQQMKFSFAPHDDSAIRVFGQPAFPTMPSPSTIPNRGSMNVPPSGGEFIPLPVIAPPARLLSNPEPTIATPSDRMIKRPASLASGHSISSASNKKPRTSNDGRQSELSHFIVSSPPIANGSTHTQTFMSQQTDGSGSPSDEDTIHVAMKTSRTPTASTTSTPYGD